MNDHGFHPAFERTLGGATNYRFVLVEANAAALL
jgi:hypothetical protein